jgi:CubicO group peptidase (beta-lactamase class C family)
MRSVLRSKLWLWTAAIATGATVAVVAPRAYRVALVGSGFSAEILCGGVFISGRDEAAVRAEDLSGPGYALLRLFRDTIEVKEKRVTASLLGLAKQTAIFRDGLGCTLIDGREEAALRGEAAGLLQPLPGSDPEAPWPLGEQVDLTSLGRGVDATKLDAAVQAAFAEPDPAHRRNTRALVVVHGGRIVVERYAPGFDAKMPLLGWSMTKAALNALVGLRVKDGKLDLADKALLPQWRGEGDKRRDISLDNLLRMSSGLAFNESYDDPLADVTQMLFVAGDQARFAAAKELDHPPGSYWHYSGGASAIIAHILRATFATEGDYLRYPRERLFGPLGMKSAILEPDASGTFAASSFLYATARDFARLGLLFLQDGMWERNVLLPDNWVVYSRGPARTSPDGSYGAHLWLRLPESEGLGVPPMPEDAYYFLGYEQQIVAIVPSRDLVIVRLGLTQYQGAWDHAKDLAPIVAAFPPSAL